MWHCARCLSVIKRLLCGKRMSHSTLHGFHYTVVIQSLRIDTTEVKHLHEWWWGWGLLKRMVHFFNDGSLRYYAEHVNRVLPLSMLFKDFSTSFGAKHHPDEPGPNRWFDLSAGKNVAPLELSYLRKQRWVLPLLSALLLLLLSMIFVDAHLRGFLSLRWKDKRMGREQKGSTQVLKTYE